MPSYCSAVNCKNNGFTQPDLSFFKFPENRKNIRTEWIKAIGRKNWQPTKYSRLCSIHFEDNCFFLKKGSRLRLLPDAIPTIFDFRKLKNNRKKAAKYLNMLETECPDPNFYRLETEQILPKSRKSGQKCQICHCLADCDITYESTIVTKRGKIPMKTVLFALTDVKISDECDGKYVCMSCCRRLIDSYWLKLDLQQNENLLKFENSNETSEDGPSIEAPKDDSINASVDQSTVDDIAYCSHCDQNLLINHISSHLIECKMRMEADRCLIPLENRRLFVCFVCRFLIYQHNADEHFDNCRKLNEFFEF